MKMNVRFYAESYKYRYQVRFVCNSKVEKWKTLYDKSRADVNHKNFSMNIISCRCPG